MEFTREDFNAIPFTEDKLIAIANKPNIFHDKNGDGYYDMLSALQKSIRGSDHQAAIFYLAKLLEGGDLESACRRLVVITYEDIYVVDDNGTYIPYSDYHSFQKTKTRLN